MMDVLDGRLGVESARWNPVLLPCFLSSQAESGFHQASETETYWVGHKTRLGFNRPSKCADFKITGLIVNRCEAIFCNSKTLF